jgi:transcriptional regulator
MYVPEPYQESRREVLVGAINARSFGTLITHGESGIKLSHVPFAVDESSGKLELICHVARPNSQWHDLSGGAEAVASFLLDDAYISPGWYPMKAETGRVVPTWNYVAIEARGRAELVETGPELLLLVEKLTERHESSRPFPWSTSDAPADFTEALLRGIVGIRICVRDLSGAWKLDQKKRAIDRAGAVEGLAIEPGGANISNRMRASLLASD